MANLDDTRKRLRDLLGDMAALRPFVDSGNEEAAEFAEAFACARDRARLAAREFANALREGAPG